MTIRPYRVSFSGQYTVLAWAETANKARALCVGHYTGSAEDEAYTDLAARLVRHLDGHPDTPAAPCVMDGYGSLPNEAELVSFSFIYRCPNCGAKWVDDYRPCECDGGTVALDQEIARAKESA